MEKILFLEGPIQTGKSTLIREVLGSDIHKCGGFASQRLVDSSGQTRGFRIGPAASTNLTAPLGKVPLAPDGTCYDNVFKYTADDGKVYTDQSVFQKDGVDLLMRAKDSPIILLDEIGGAELLCDSFVAALEEVLGSGLPCIGVFKLAEKARQMQRTYGSDLIVERNQQLRQRILEEYHGTILYYDRDLPGSRERVRRELESFLKGVKLV